MGKTTISDAAFAILIDHADACAKAIKENLNLKISESKKIVSMYYGFEDWKSLKKCLSPQGLSFLSDRIERENQHTHFRYALSNLESLVSFRSWLREKYRQHESYTFLVKPNSKAILNDRFPFNTPPDNFKYILLRKFQDGLFNLEDRDELTFDEAVYRFSDQEDVDRFQGNWRTEVANLTSNSWVDQPELLVELYLRKYSDPHVFTIGNLQGIFEHLPFKRERPKYGDDTHALWEKFLFNYLEFIVNELGQHGWLLEIDQIGSWVVCHSMKRTNKHYDFDSFMRMTDGSLSRVFELVQKAEAFSNEINQAVKENLDSENQRKSCQKRKSS